MSVKDIKGIQLSSGFKLLSEDLLDKRCSLPTEADRDELVTIGAAPVGIIVYVQESKRTYQYNGNGNWEYFSKGAEYVHPTGDGNLHVPKTGTTNNGRFLRAGSTAGSLSWITITPAMIGAAASGHHHSNDTIDNIDASKVTTGVFDIARIPKAAMERCVKVADDTARFALTTNDAQKGDTVKVLSTGKMYFVVDDTKLDRDAGYEVYIAGAASEVPWSGVTDKPTTMVNPYALSIKLNGGISEGIDKFTYTGSNAMSVNITPENIGASIDGHTHSYSEITDTPDSLKNPFGLTVKLNNNIYTYDGSSDKIINITPVSIGASAEGHTHLKQDILDLVIPTKLPNPAALTIAFNNTDQVSYSGDVSKILNITPESIDAARTEHTHTKSEITDFPTSLKNPTSLTMQFNGVAAGVYDGSAAKTVNITPSNIGASAEGHTHTTSNITDFPTSLKSPTKLTIKLNGGSTEGTNLFTYDGASAKTINITPSAIGAAANHTHPYVPLAGGTMTGRITIPSLPGQYLAGKTISNASIGISTQNDETSYHPILAGKTQSSHVWNFGTIMNKVGLFGFLSSRNINGTDWSTQWDVGTGDITHTGNIKAASFEGNASTATALETARTIKLTGDVSGSASFDGTGDTSITTAVANDSHTHSNSTIVNIDASKITSGTIDIARLPKGAVERCVVVASDTARFALTTASVQTGDTVKVTGTGKMYFVIDDTKLSTEAGYEIYTAGSASSVPWSGVTGKPTTFTPSAHTHTKSDITDFPTSLKNPTSLRVQLNSGTTEGTNQFTYDGSTSKSFNITPASIGAATSGHTHSGYAASSHTHNMDDITDLEFNGTTEKSLVIKFNGASVEGTNMFTFNGSAVKTVNITPSAIGAAASDHTHNGYAASDHTHSGYAASSHTHSYLPLAGGTMTGGISVPMLSSTYLRANQGNVPINSTAAAGTFQMLYKGNSTNGYFMHGVYQTGYKLFYTAKSTVTAENNLVTKSATLLDESGNTSFPGKVTASSFAGNATSATKVAVPVGTVMMATSSTTTFFATCFGGTWECIGNIDAVVGSTSTTFYMFKKTAA